MPPSVDIRPDQDRARRLGFDEAVFCESKSPEQIGRLIAAAKASGESLLLTRLSPEQRDRLPDRLGESLDYDPLSRTGYAGTVAEPKPPARVAVVSAGSSDVGVAREAVRTLGYYGVAASELYDVGVAGLWRLLERVDELRRMPAVITVAGMDGALPSVVAGLVPGLVVAVPVSVGYGVGAGGSAALATALTSCAPGLVVVNIDNGYGAACAVLRMLKTMAGETR